MTRLRAEALDFRDHQPAHARFGQRLAHLLELERLDRRNDEFHLSVSPSLAGSCLRPAPDKGSQKPAVTG